MKRIKDETVRRAVRAALALALLISLFAGTLPSLVTTRASASAELVDAELYQALLDLTNPWTVMCVAAHPDDEDGATLTVLRRKMGVHTVSLFSTYGEGGQNATGPELYEELGVIRARETEEAARIQGSEANFLGLKDFGFSKSAEEAFRIWGHDEALRRMVLKIRELRPDVIITNHDTSGGHGHHQATGRLVLEAFDAAADPARFPEQLRDRTIQPWQVQRLFVRAGYEGGAAGKALDDEAARTGKIITIDRNERDPVRGTTYAEQALQALRKHASQGPWPQTLPPTGWPAVRYRLAREAKQAAPFPPNAQTFLDGLSLPAEVASKLLPLAARAVLPFYQGANVSRESVLAALVALRRGKAFYEADANNERPRFQLMNERLDYALAVAARVSAELKPESVPLLIPGMQMSYSVFLYNQGGSDVQVKRSSFLVDGRAVGSSTSSSLLKSNTSLRSEPVYPVPQTAAINVPQAEHLYDGHLFGEELSQEFLLEVEGAAFTVKASRRFNVAPPVEIESVSPSPLVITPQTFRRGQLFTFHITNNLSTPVEVLLRSGKLENVESGRDISIPARSSLDVTRQYIVPVAAITNVEQRVEFSVTEKFSLWRTNSSSATSPVTERAVKIAYAAALISPNLRVGYVRSTDFTLPAALAALGVKSKELTVDEIRAGNLGSYDAIIIDNRGYQVHPELIQLNQKLLDYAQQGGTLIVFYHKTNEWNPDAKASRPQLAPYEILLGNSRVTDENAPVTFTDPQHPLLNFPNKITARDFNGWIQERGLYFPKEWDKRYSAPLAMSDAGEPQLQGGLLAAEYGRGRYIYTSIVWYRQLREGLPGAYRVLANMLSYGRTDKK
ncbi:MAG TPA: PIG-L family deacetylase [Pyrinomonadaceae bacterium]